MAGLSSAAVDSPALAGFTVFDPQTGAAFAFVYGIGKSKSSLNGKDIMDRFTSEDLKQLVQTPDASGPYVSMLLPMYRAGREVQQNETRFKNAIATARNQLQDADCDDAAVAQILRPAENLLNDANYWQHQSDGLAVFAGPDEFKTFRLPCDFEEAVVTGDQYHVKPLTRLLMDDQHWHILAASPNRVRLLRATLHSVEELHPDNFPQNLRDALNIDEYVSALQFHSSSGQGREAAIHHGQGGSDPDVKKQDEILQYFQRLDAALTSHFQDESQPLIFAGVEYLFPIFKEASDYSNILPDAITGNPDDLSAAELHEKSLAIMKPRIRGRHTQLLTDYHDRAATDWASDDLGELLEVAAIGQIETLCVDPSREHRDAGDYAPSDDRATSGRDLFNDVIVQTLVNGGNVIGIDPSDEVSSELPDSGICAVFRSPAGAYIGQS